MNRHGLSQLAEAGGLVAAVLVLGFGSGTRTYHRLRVRFELGEDMLSQCIRW